MSWGGDNEKAPTSPAEVVITRGVRVSSRYQKQHEITLLVRAVDLMPACMCEAILELWCDSKAYTFNVDLHPDWNCPEVRHTIAAWLSAYMLFYSRGHNGIYVGDPAECVEPHWDLYGEDDTP